MPQRCTPPRQRSSPLPDGPTRAGAPPPPALESRRPPHGQPHRTGRCQPRHGRAVGVVAGVVVERGLARPDPWRGSGRACGGGGDGRAIARRHAATAVTTPSCLAVNVTAARDGGGERKGVRAAEGERGVTFGSRAGTAEAAAGPPLLSSGGAGPQRLLLQPPAVERHAALSQGRVAPCSCGWCLPRCPGLPPWPFRPRVPRTLGAEWLLRRFHPPPGRTQWPSAVYAVGVRTSAPAIGELLAPPHG